MLHTARYCACIAEECNWSSRLGLAPARSCRPSPSIPCRPSSPVPSLLARSVPSRPLPSARSLFCFCSRSRVRHGIVIASFRQVSPGQYSHDPVFRARASSLVTGYRKYRSRESEHARQLRYVVFPFLSGYRNFVFRRTRFPKYQNCL
jgi:hypothetical protein